MRQSKLVIVEWDDIESNPSWMRIDELDERAKTWKCSSVGWKMPSDRKTLRIAATRAKDKEKVADVTSIPRGCVRSVKELDICH